MTAFISKNDNLDLYTPPTFASQALPAGKIPVEGDKKLLSKFLPASQFDITDKKADDKDNSFNTMMLFSLFATQTADDNGTVSGQDLAGFIGVLEHMGVNVEPFKQAIETITGKTYADLSSGSTTRFDVSGFYNENPKSGARTPIVRNEGFDSLKALRIAASDNAGEGKCARGVFNIAKGLGWDVTAGNATTWDKTLPQNGWVKLKGVNSANAPEGAVLVYNNDKEAGRGASYNGHGAQFGHVEIVAEGKNGERLYVSDKARHNAGGSVPKNFEGAYIYVGDNAPASNLAIAKTFNQDAPKLASASHHAPAPALS